MVKRAGATLHSRVPVAKAVREWAARVEGLEGDVAAIQAQERQEMELRRAEMEATKVCWSRDSGQPRYADHGELWHVQGCPA